MIWAYAPWIFCKGSVSQVAADFSSAIHTEKCSNRSAFAASYSLCPRGSITKLTSPTDLTITLPRAFTVAINTAGISNTYVTVFALPANITFAISRVFAVSFTARRAYRGITESTGPTSYTIALAGLSAGSMQTAFRCCAVGAVFPTIPVIACTHIWFFTSSSSSVAGTRTFRRITKHSGPPFLTFALKTLPAIPVQAARQLHTTSAAFPRIAEITCALPWLSAVSMLRITVLSTNRNLTKIPLPARKTLNLVVLACVTRLSSKFDLRAGLYLP